MNLLTWMILFTFEDGPKYWFIRGEVNKTLETIVKIHNKNCKFVTEGASLDDETNQEEGTAQDFQLNDIVNKNKQVAGIEQYNKKISIETLSEELGLDEYDLTKFNVTIKILKNSEDPKEELAPFKLLFSKDYRWILLGLGSMIISEYSLYYSTSFDTSTLDFGSTNINMIVFAVFTLITLLVL